MVDILNLALPYFGLIFIGFACGKARGLPEQGLAWMNFFLLYVSLPALLFRIMSKTPIEEHCPAERHLDRTRIRRRADRDVCLRHHAHQRDVAVADRPDRVSVRDTGSREQNASKQRR
jgi:hypothetical protein